MLSIIIATKDRSESISAISLPSLLRQDYTDFEVLIWDASSDDATLRAVEPQKSAFDSRGIPLIYHKAERLGSASQRNDAVKLARGDILLFLDDDSEASSNAICVVEKYFLDFSWLTGMALPLINKFSGNFRRKRGVIGAIKKIFYRPFFGRDAMRREIRYSTNNAMPMMDAPGTADWLSGCCMAYRASVFGELQFDERLQRFGGYAMGEDVDFSHRVALKFGEPLLVVPEGHVVHHNSSGGRIGGERARIAAMYYNTKIIRENFTKYAEYGLLPFLWEQRVGRTIAMLAGGYSFADMAGGYLDYRKALREN